MTWQIHFDEPKRIVHAKVTGTLQSRPLRQMTEELRDAVLRHGAGGVFLDYTETISRLEPYVIFERPRILQEIGFPADIRVAVLYMALDENTQFLENVYRNKNYPVRVFADQEQAFAWLAS